MTRVVITMAACAPVPTRYPVKPGTVLLRCVSPIRSPMTKLGTPMMIPSMTYPPKRSHHPASTADPVVVLMEGPVEYCGGGAPMCIVHWVPSHQRCAGCPDGSG